MESCTAKDQTELSEDTQPILVQEDSADTNFPITNTSTITDSENSDKKESTVTEDHSKITFGSENFSDSGLINIAENMKYTTSEKSEASNESVKTQLDVKNEPLSHEDEDDGLMKKLGKLCGVDKQKLLEEGNEQYIKSPNERVGERLALQGNRNELSEKNQFLTLRSPGMVGGSAIKHVHNELQPKLINIEGVQEMQGGGQSVCKKHSETRTLKVSHTIQPVDSNLYNFTHSERGYMLTIVNDRFVNMSRRDGAHWDLLKMKDIARKFGFRFLNNDQERNLSKSETLQVLSRASKANHSDCDCFVFMISTHGLEKENALKGGKVDNALVCADDQLIFTSTIIEMFNDEHCPTLKGKPKIFFIQACRVKPNRRIRESFDASDTRLGQDSWAASQTGSTGRVVDKIYAPTPHTIVKTPPLKCDNDMLVMFAIPPGMFAWRSTTQGSWMIDYLHQVLMAYDMQQPKNFLNFLTQVAALMSQRETNTPSNPSMHGMKAVSVIEHKLVKAIVFQQKVPFSE